MKMMRILMMLLLVASLTASADAQTARGKVKDTNGEELIGASVRVVGTRLGARTHLEGKYWIKQIPKGQYTLIASYVGYSSDTAQVLIESDSQVVEANFTLRLPVGHPPLQCELWESYHEKLRRLYEKNPDCIELKIVDGWLRDSLLVVQLQVVNHTDLEIFIPKGNTFAESVFHDDLRNEDGSDFNRNNAMLLTCSSGIQTLYNEGDILTIEAHTARNIEPVEIQNHKFGGRKGTVARLVMSYDFTDLHFEAHWSLDKSSRQPTDEEQRRYGMIYCRMLRLPLTTKPEPVVVR